MINGARQPTRSTREFGPARRIPSTRETPRDALPPPAGWNGIESPPTGGVPTSSENPRLMADTPRGVRAAGMQYTNDPYQSPPEGRQHASPEQTPWDPERARQTLR